MSNENEVADVLSHLLTLCEDLADAKTKQQKALWAIDAKVAMNKGFALINGMVVEQHQLKAEVEALRKDAERYRGVRRVANSQGWSDEQFDASTDQRVARFAASVTKGDV